MEIKVGGPAAAVRTEDFRVVYTNAAKIQLTPWDLKFIFGQLLDAADGTTTNQESVCVVMSPQHAKALLNHWTNTMKTYEATFGPIDDPTPKLEEFAKQAAAGKEPKSSR